MPTIAYKYRLYPSRAQETALEEALEVCRRVYNSLRDWRKFAYETEGKSVGYYEQLRSLPVWKKRTDEAGTPLHPELKSVHAHLLQNVAWRVELAYQAFFRRISAGKEHPGYPRRKGHTQYESLTFKEWGNGCVLADKTLRVSKIGDIEVVLHRALECMRIFQRIAGFRPLR